MKLKTPRIDLDHRNKTALCLMSAGIDVYSFVILLRYFAQQADDRGYWLQLDVSY